MWLPLAFVCMVATIGGVRAITENDIRIMVEEYNRLAISHCNAEVQASWNVETNIGDEDNVDILVRYEHILM